MTLKKKYNSTGKKNMKKKYFKKKRSIRKINLRKKSKKNTKRKYLKREKDTRKKSLSKKVGGKPNRTRRTGGSPRRKAPLNPLLLSLYDPELLERHPLRYQWPTQPPPQPYSSQHQPDVSVSFFKALMRYFKIQDYDTKLGLEEDIDDFFSLSNYQSTLFLHGIPDSDFDEYNNFIRRLRHNIKIISHDDLKKFYLLYQKIDIRVNEITPGTSVRNHEFANEILELILQPNPIITSDTITELKKSKFYANKVLKDNYADLLKKLLSALDRDELPGILDSFKRLKEELDIFIEEKYKTLKQTERSKIHSYLNKLQKEIISLKFESKPLIGIITLDDLRSILQLYMPEFIRNMYVNELTRKQVDISFDAYLDNLLNNDYLDNDQKNRETFFICKILINLIKENEGDAKTTKDKLYYIQKLNETFSAHFVAKDVTFFDIKKDSGGNYSYLYRNENANLIRIIEIITESERYKYYILLMNICEIMEKHFSRYFKVWDFFRKVKNLFEQEDQYQNSPEYLQYITELLQTFHNESKELTNKEQFTYEHTNPISE